MSWHETRDPYNSFYETVQVGRVWNSNHDVTIYYCNRGRGGKWKMFLSSFLRYLDFAMLWSKYIQHSLAFILLLEFSITDGGRILWEQQDGNDRRLGVETRNGHTFSITRRHGGGLCVCLLHFSQSESNMSKLVQLKTIRFYLEGYVLNTSGFRKNELGRTYF